MIGRGGSDLAWRDGDIALVVATALVGLIAILAAWFGASGSPTLTNQVAWLNLAVAGFAIFAIGNCLWLLRGRRAVGERRVALISLEAEEGESPVASTASTAFSTVSLELVRGAGMARVHYPDCPLVAGKALEPAGLSVGEPCGVCAA